MRDFTASHAYTGVQASKSEAKTVARVQGLDKRAHTASATATQPDKKTGMVGLKLEVQTNHRIGLEIHMAKSNNKKTPRRESTRVHFFIALSILTLFNFGGHAFLGGLACKSGLVCKPRSAT